MRTAATWSSTSATVDFSGTRPVSKVSIVFPSIVRAAYEADPVEPHFCRSQPNDVRRLTLRMPANSWERKSYYPATTFGEILHKIFAFTLNVYRVDTLKIFITRYVYVELVN